MPNRSRNEKIMLTLALLGFIFSVGGSVGVIWVARQAVEAREYRFETRRLLCKMAARRDEVYPECSAFDFTRGDV